MKLKYNNDYKIKSIDRLINKLSIYNIDNMEAFEMINDDYKAITWDMNIDYLIDELLEAGFYAGEILTLVNSYYSGIWIYYNNEYGYILDTTEAISLYINHR